MSNKQQAVADLKRFANGLKGVMSIVDDLDALGAMEQTIEDYKAKIEHLKKDTEAAEKALADVKAKTTVAEAEHKSRMAEMETSARLWRENAEQVATKIKADAQVEASARVADAEAKAAAVRREIEKSEKDLVAVNKRIADARATYSGVASQLDELKRKIA